MEKYNENKTNNILLFIASAIIVLMIGMLYLMNGKLNQYKDLLENTDTTSTTLVDTLYLDKVHVDSVPKYINQKIYKTDTVYKKEGDSISATPMLIELKKKKQVEL